MHVQLLSWNQTWLVLAGLVLGDGLLDESQILLVHVEEHGDGSGN